MKNKAVKRVLSLLVATLMLCTACGDTSGSADKSSAESEPKPSSSSSVAEPEESKYPEYLNLDSAYPVIKDEYVGQVKPKILIAMNDGCNEWDDLWMSKYFKEKYNLEFEVEYVSPAAIAERKTLILNSGELPDMMINVRISTAEIVKYGQEEGLLLPMDEYMNEELTPNILMYQDTLDRSCTTSDGHVYTLPYLSDGPSDGGNYERYFINEKVLTENNLTVPTTLDEFVDTMYALKEIYPDSYPFGGAIAAGDWSITNNLLQAFGFVNTFSDRYGTFPAIRDGEVVLPVYEMDVYKEFLTIMNQFYQDGILHPDFFTITGTEINALVNEGKMFTYGGAPISSGMTTWADWTTMRALTSEWQTEPEVPTPADCSVGGFVISADTEYPELCLRFADIFFNITTDCSGYLWGGTGRGSEYSFEDEGYVMRVPMTNNTVFNIPTEDLPAGYSSPYEYKCMAIHGAMWNLGNYSTYGATRVAMKDATGIELPETPIRDLGNADNHFRNSIEENIMQYAAETYPSIIYLSEETTEELTDLRTVVMDYAEEQIALFITGRRSLEEVDAFKEELKSMGIEDLIAIYQSAYVK